MRGTNPVRKQVKDEGDFLRVQEVFTTIQGEGPLVGVPATFVRMAGCNLRCWFCDTEFDSEWDRGYRLTSELAEHIHSLGSDLVVLTGGEPLLQNLLPLCDDLISRGHLVQIETAGTVTWQGSLDQLPDSVQIIVSPKTPVVHSYISARARAWKYVITGIDDVSAVDGLPVTSTQWRGQSSLICRPPKGTYPHQVFLQPCDFGLNKEASKAAVDACIKLSMKYGYRLSLQMHKIVGLP